MPEANRNAIDENGIRIGKLNLPTVTFSVLLLCIFSLALIIAFKPQDDLLATIVFLTCPIASFAGLLTLVWCFIKREQFTGEKTSRYFWEAVLIGAAAFTSPIWLIIISVMIFGFNR